MAQRRPKRSRRSNRDLVTAASSTSTAIGSSSSLQLASQNQNDATTPSNMARHKKDRRKKQEQKQAQDRAEQQRHSRNVSSASSSVNPPGTPATQEDHPGVEEHSGSDEEEEQVPESEGETNYQERTPKANGSNDDGPFILKPVTGQRLLVGGLWTAAFLALIAQMSPMAATLPTPRALLTSLINTLSSFSPATPISGPQPGPSPNPLKFLPTQARPLLATLHTLYPNVLLPALDLLDRRLVTRIIPVHNGNVAATAAPVQQDVRLGDEAEGAMPEEGNKTHQEANFFYLVRSAQQPSRRGRRAVEALAEGGAGAGPTYVVQTRAWNCSCAAFAFSAFPAEGDAPVYRIYSSSSSSSGRRSDALYGWSSDKRRQQEHAERQNDDAWDFGSMSRDGLVPEEDGDGVGVGTGGVPCCKHLLACVLAERWQDVMGGYVGERQAGKEEAAGLVAGI